MANDERVGEFLNRPLTGEWPHVWLDATYLKVRQGGRIVPVAAIIAVAANTEGRREIIGLGIGPSEAETFWTEFLRSLRARGLASTVPGFGWSSATPTPASRPPGVDGPDDPPGDAPGTGPGGAAAAGAETYPPSDAPPDEDQDTTPDTATAQSDPETTPMPSPSRRHRNAEVDFRGEKRSNATHASTTDPDARLFRKSQGTGAMLCYMGHTLMENRHGLIVQAELTRADGHAERRAALDMVQRRRTQNIFTGFRRRGCDVHVHDRAERACLADRGYLAGGARG